MIDVPVAGSAREQIENLMSSFSAVEAFSVIEHRFGVLPLLEAFFELPGAMREKSSGGLRGSLGLFTPSPEPGWGAVMLSGEPGGNGWFVSGEVRLPSRVSDGSIVLVRAAEAGPRLAWLDHAAPGVERLGGEPCKLRIEGVAVGSDLVSRPVSLGPGSDLARLLESYAGTWALAAAIAAQEGVRSLRRAARTQGFSTSQWVALGITEVEIEADLTLAAAQRNPGIAVAAAAARTLSEVARRTEELRDSAGLEAGGPLAGDSARILTAYLGGAVLLENELARALGIEEARR